MQNLIVYLIVGAAALYALWRWMPAPWRRGLAGRLATGSQRVGLLDARRAGRLAASLGRSSGCGACDSCEGCAPGQAEDVPTPPR